MNFMQYPNYQTSPYTNPYAQPFNNPYGQKLANYDQMAQNINNSGLMQQNSPMPTQIPNPNMNVNTPVVGVRNVTNIEETRSIIPNFDGSETVFKDTTNKKVYLKYLNLNGLPQTDIYTLEESNAKVEEKKTETVAGASFVTKEEFESLKLKVEQYEQMLSEQAPTKTVKKTTKTDKGDVE